VIRAVVDTNVLASGFVRSNPLAAPVQLLDAWRAQRFELISSAAILAELERTLRSPYFARRLSEEQIEQDLLLLTEEASFTEVTAVVSGVATHPEDDRILATAVSARADYLVTGDAPFRRRVPGYQGVVLVGPREFLELLEQADGGQP
jgi:putative PIN family toxin of toxin-antitoxin system